MGGGGGGGGGGSQKMLSSPSTQCDRDDAAKEADWSWRMSLLHLCAEATRGAELWPGQFEMARNTKAAGA